MSRKRESSAHIGPLFQTRRHKSPNQWNIAGEGRKLAFQSGLYHTGLYEPSKIENSILGPLVGIEESIDRQIDRLAGRKVIVGIGEMGMASFIKIAAKRKKQIVA